MDNQSFKSVRHSHTVITELMVPSYANFGGKIHGGTILSLMDKVAYVCAAKHAGAYCVTASIDTVNFLAPVEVGELLSLKAMVNYVGKSSLVVGIRVESENVKTNIVKHTNTSYFTMVAKGEDDKPLTVPGLLLETRDEIRRFVEAIKRKKFKETVMHEAKRIKTPMEIQEAYKLLEAERCKIDIVL